MHDLISPYLGEKLIINVSDFRSFFQADNMKTPSALVQKIIETTKTEFDQLENLNFNFEVQKKYGRVENFIFYPYKNVPTIYNSQINNNKISDRIIEETFLEKSIEERIENFPEKMTSKIAANQKEFLEGIEEKKEENIKSDFEEFEKIATPNYENFNSDDIQSALERMKNLRQNDTNKYGG
ncbi:MAG: hypothetical protein E6Q35_07295 [Chryseobacterium cucumeris]|nr:MAG: hypothetical protein E6Q35_07295 [Chryseobacterium cucumeris]